MVSRTPNGTPGAAAPVDAARLAVAHALIERETVPAQSPSAVLAVARHAGPASIRGFGLARWEPVGAAAPPGADTIYALASITKPFVAVAAVQLAERGALELDDPVVRHVPEFGAGAGDRAAVTVRHLLAHTAGLGGGWVDDRVRADPQLVRTWEAFVRTTCASPLLFAPGTRSLYASANATLLAEVVRRRSGLRIDAYLRERVFAPLGMRDTGFFPQDDPRRRARVAQVASSRWPADRTPRTTINALFPADVKTPRPGGGLYASAHDLVTFGRACLRLLRGESVAEAPVTRAGLAAMLVHQTAGLPAHDPGKAGKSARGLGWELPGLDGDPDRRDGWSASAFGHAGSSGTVLRIDPTRDLIVDFLGSRTGGLKSKQRVTRPAARPGARSAAGDRRERRAASRPEVTR